MTNIDIELDGKTLILKIDLSENHGPSKSGKTTIIATTSGNTKIPGTDAILGLNCYKPRG